MTLFNVARINLCTEVEGPYRRLAIWFQGCDIRCPGCSNESMQPLVPAHLMSLEKLVSVISEAVAKFNIEGVTYLGGEPTLQRSLPLLSKSIHDIGLGVIAFTGRKFEDVVTILEGCDLVIDGPYVEHLRSFHRRIVGSSNQRFIHLSERYSSCEEWFDASHDEALIGEFNLSKDSLIFNGSTI